jgi:NAD-dependent deacetylase
MTVEEFAARVKQSRHLVFFTGAGISTQSGVPDFRSPGGVWSTYQPVMFQDFMASADARVQHWQLKKATYELFKTVKPNIGHYAICEFEKRDQLLGLITQNIDGLHKIAGTSAEKLVELHGTDRWVTCLQCGKLPACRRI